MCLLGNTDHTMTQLTKKNKNMFTRPRLKILKNAFHFLFVSVVYNKLCVFVSVPLNANLTALHLHNCQCYSMFLNVNVLNLTNISTHSIKTNTSITSKNTVLIVHQSCITLYSRQMQKDKFPGVANKTALLQMCMTLSKLDYIELSLAQMSYFSCSDHIFICCFLKKNSYYLATVAISSLQKHSFTHLNMQFQLSGWPRS